MQEVFKDLGASLRRKPGEGLAPPISTDGITAPPAPPKNPRKPDETPAQYLERLKQEAAGKK